MVMAIHQTHSEIVVHNLRGSQVGLHQKNNKDFIFND
jgi:hypothetical protein